MTQRLPRLAYDIGKKFGNKKLTVSVDSDFKEVTNASGGITRAYSLSCELSDGHLCVYLRIPREITDIEKEIRIAHEFGEIEFRKNHPRISKTLHRYGSNRFVGELAKIINDSLADAEARKKGFNIPYWYHYQPLKRI